MACSELSATIHVASAHSHETILNNVPIAVSPTAAHTSIIPCPLPLYRAPPPQQKTMTTVTAFSMTVLVLLACASVGLGRLPSTAYPWCSDPRAVRVPVSVGNGDPSTQSRPTRRPTPRCAPGWIPMATAGRPVRLRPSPRIWRRQGELMRQHFDTRVNTHTHMLTHPHPTFALC